MPAGFDRVSVFSSLLVDCSLLYIGRAGRKAPSFGDERVLLFPPESTYMTKLTALAAASLLTWTFASSSAHAGPIAYLGPAGSWTHQACLDLFGEKDLVPLTRDELFSSYKSGKVERACVPVTTSVVGVTPYMDAVLDLP
ncbi:prephenate dehydratase domain-containing protein, partial [Variovorax sp. RHLX14]|uniref:prephenate dehydratase domain-containing protein n=1 Tax=Variovorax sp. RHLX14 TaxID=1259731 RepID=UPI003F48C45E